ncbi:MAG: hypothetical protein V1735_06330 [Nanoarchaeota archaeon]
MKKRDHNIILNVSEAFLLDLEAGRVALAKDWQTARVRVREPTISEAALHYIKLGLDREGFSVRKTSKRSWWD